MYRYFLITLIVLTFFQYSAKAETTELGKCFLAEFLDVTDGNHNSKRNIFRSSDTNSNTGKLNETLADIDYYKARVRSVEVLMAKEKTAQHYHALQLKRHESLIASHTISKEEFEDTKERSEQIALNLVFLESIMNERRAELKGAEARLEQLNESDSR